MKVVGAFFRLIRWPNLIFISLTQFLFFICIYATCAHIEVRALQFPNFLALMLASVCIAAAGYVINDYFDIKIDRENKPHKMVVEKIIKRRWAIVWHLVLSAVGLILSLYISYRVRSLPIAIGNILCVLALMLYSTTFKRKLLIGNVIIAILTAWVIVVMYFFAGGQLTGWPGKNSGFDFARFYKLTVLYAAFAGIVSLIREAVKDVEDMYGDGKYGCTTMPIVWGVPATKMYTAVLAVVCVGLLAALEVYAFFNGWYIAAVYSILCITFPLLLFIKRLYAATLPLDFRRLSSLVKAIMLAGILSMVFFLFL